MLSGRANISTSQTSHLSSSLTSRCPQVSPSGSGGRPARNGGLSAASVIPASRAARGQGAARPRAQGGGRGLSTRPASVPQPCRPGARTVRVPRIWRRRARAARARCGGARGGAGASLSVTAGGGGGRRWWRRRQRQRRRLFRHEAAAARGSAAAAAGAASLAQEAAPGGGRASRVGVAGAGSAAVPRTGRRLRGPRPPRPAFGARRLRGAGHPRPPRRPRRPGGAAWPGQAPLDGPRRRGRLQRRGLRKLARGAGPRRPPARRPRGRRAGGGGGGPAAGLDAAEAPLGAQHEGPAAAAGRSVFARAARGVRRLGWTSLRSGLRSRRVRAEETRRGLGWRWTGAGAAARGPPGAPGPAGWLRSASREGRWSSTQTFPSRREQTVAFLVDRRGPR